VKADTKLDAIREVHTPEGVALRLLAAGPFPRALAWVIDAGVRFALIWAGAMALSMLGELGDGMFLIVLFVLTWFYPVIFEVMWNGQTPGKRALGIRVVATNGAPTGWMAAFARNLLRVVDMLPVGYATGLVTGLIDPWGRRLGDLVAGTLVVHVARAPGPLKTAAVPAHRPALPLLPEEQLAVIAFAERAGTLTAERQRELAELALPVTKQPGQAGVHALLGIANWLVGAVPVSPTPAAETGTNPGRGG